MLIQKSNDSVNNLCDLLKTILKNNQNLLNIYTIKRFYFFKISIYFLCIKWLILATNHGIRLEFL